MTVVRFLRISDVLTCSNNFFLCKKIFTLKGNRMTSNYWNQWDKSDLDSWQGKDYPGHDEEEDIDEDFDESDPEDEEIDEEPGCSCGYYCFECLGMSWQDFM